MDYNPPNTRQRIAARRMARQGSQVRPDTRRATLNWLASGRLFSLLVFLVSVGALGYLLSSGRYSIQQIQVRGADALKPAQVIVESDLLGRPIWFVGTTATEARLRANPYIESAQVTLGLPNQAMIAVVERRPEVRWQVGTVQYLVDGSGQVLAAAQEPAAADVLVVTDRTSLDLKPGDTIDTDALRLTQALALRLPVELGFSPTQIGWDAGVGVYVRSPAGQTIIFGQSTQLDRKLAILKTLLSDQTAFTYLDLRPENPFYQNVQSNQLNQQPTTSSQP